MKLNTVKLLRQAINSCDTLGDLHIDFFKALQIIFNSDYYEGQEEDQQWIIELEQEYLIDIETQVAKRCKAWDEFYIINSTNFVDWYNDLDEDTCLLLPME